MLKEKTIYIIQDCDGKEFVKGEILIVGRIKGEDYAVSTETFERKKLTNLSLTKSFYKKQFLNCIEKIKNTFNFIEAEGIKSYKKMRKEKVRFLPSPEKVIHQTYPIINLTEKEYLKEIKN